MIFYSSLLHYFPLILFLFYITSHGIYDSYILWLMYFSFNMKPNVMLSISLKICSIDLFTTSAMNVVWALLALIWKSLRVTRFSCSFLLYNHYRLSHLYKWNKWNKQMINKIEISPHIITQMKIISGARY